MDISIFSLIMLMFVTLCSSVAFVITTSGLTKRSLDRSAYLSSKIVWTALPVAIQLALVLLAFHPIGYIVILAIIAILEWITIRRRGENPATRFVAWLYFSIWPLAGLFVSATTVNGIWRIGASNLLLYILVPLTIVGVGIIRILLCGPSAAEAEEASETDETDEPDEADETETDDDPADIESAEDEIDDNLDDEPESNELDDEVA